AGAAASGAKPAGAKAGSVDDNRAVPATVVGNRGSQAPHVRSFQEKLSAHAEEASLATGIPAKFMLGQAALESGWGKREIKGRDGTNSHNLFGIKAGADWKGKTVDATTTEYVNGRAQTRVEKFRAYDSYADSFKDYAKLLANNPRYEKVLASGGDASSFARGLQQAGYATDPQYAAKLTSIITRSLAG
ncbi:MAG TPA: flagellar assembly peptidoglycan hydrolase FlgJ, partial [Duganella sp.]|nr:flagellar assembly peptidoglycan hydrolase FlgJ [Duganella sp.]